MKKILFIGICLFLSLIISQFSSAQQTSETPVINTSSIELAPVMIDDVVVFRVRGVEAFPAKERAQVISKRIKDIASDPTIKIDSIVAIEAEHTTDIYAGDRFIISITEPDVAVEKIPSPLLAKIYIKKLGEAIEEYREARSSKNIFRGILYSIIATILLICFLILFPKLYRKFHSFLETRFKTKIYSFQIKSFEIIQGQSIWMAITKGLKIIRLIIILLLLYIYLHIVLSLFPWTSLLASHLLDYVVDPFKKIGVALVEYIPNLIFIVILVLIAKYALKLIRLFFSSIEGGAIQIGRFDPEWAKPTYNIVRLLVIVFVAVVIYPYIPGSQTPAFKGLSIFLGVLFSLGSSSTISNIMAGYTLIYRRVFKIGDRVKIDEFCGDVTERGLQVTHLRTAKNEEIIVPNSLILNSHVINYNSLARERGLILYTTIPVGYDVPWRQVNALLLMAADKTEGVIKDPKPFVFQKSLDSFYITYELNAYTNIPQEMPKIYSDLHKNILDAFNEYGIQIMIPAYEGDPGKPKVVPKENWFAPPAKKT